MTIRAEFQPTVDEFMSNLESFATGDYLKEEEKEFWEAPFDATVLPDLRNILESFLDDLDKLPDDPEGGLLSAAVRPSVEKLAAFNRKNADAVLEPEEKEELTELIHSASAATGADDDALGQLPELDF
ncbi:MULTISPECIES: hypothetical protein [Corynebacterium]|uniref:YtpA n=1 Tax=Corynebacterium hiratae TaxID=3139423 RepID=A0A553G0Q7_9CORY|nr:MULTISPECIES: hypothetical protein [Corynebacterium]OFK65469.1 hypothetical protein HMPREF2806_11675 [Corynebacterium sp. HMSC076G08]OFK66805.1 hypothetical protein HMPREF2807_08470 [Corynebacterium sp. HMSC074A09]OFN35431.1 hypothetical protein HMPREF2565_07060 [Corynebacterium sp. HMSC072A04]OHO55715.1 hypothetical protein HMPREF2635_00450 [Corynebacterium sp. HMSC035E02]TRX63080.1 hypothetical protein FNY97_04055 [Corynebacterium aurimucosum]